LGELLSIPKGVYIKKIPEVKLQSLFGITLKGYWKLRML
jgi:hypothetical protein